MKLTRGKKFIIVLMITGVGILSFVVLLLAVKYFLFPSLEQNLQAYLLSLVGAVVLVLAILANLAQITGYSVRDLFSSSSNMQSARVEKPVGKTEAMVKPARATNNERAVYLINEIQTSLYGDNSQLPKVLTLCLDLCDTVGLSDEYGEWLRRELNGFQNIEEFKKKFPDHDQYEEWMDKWMIHRQVDAYIKFTYRSAETGRQEIKNLPIPKFFVVWSIAYIIDTLKDAKDKGVGEMAFVLREVAPDIFEKMRVENKKAPWNIDTPYDLQAFMNFAGFNRILNDVRERILVLLSRARQILAESI